jgi:exopolysaccharide production protein ExoY
MQRVMQIGRQLGSRAFQNCTRLLFHRDALLTQSFGFTTIMPVSSRFPPEFHPELWALQTSALGLRAPTVAGGANAALERAGRAVVIPPQGPLGQPIGGVLKRAMDLAIGVIAIALLAPVMLIVAALIRLTMGGPVVFAQRRIGFEGSVFTCYKFRTMIPNAEEELERHLAADPSAAQEWRETHKLRHDPRISCLGHILRKSSLDELPQLFNVLRGDMSIVGPRPVVPAEIVCYGAYARECLKARPGLTGFWQVSGRNTVSYARRVALDRYYVRSWSVWLDVWVLIKTIPAVLSSQNTA